MAMLPAVSPLPYFFVSPESARSIAFLWSWVVLLGLIPGSAAVAPTPICLAAVPTATLCFGDRAAVAAAAGSFLACPGGPAGAVGVAAVVFFAWPGGTAADETGAGAGT